MLKKVKVSLQPLVSKINLPNVLKTAILPGDSIERLFIATQVGEIFYIGNGVLRTFLDIRAQILKLGVSRGGTQDPGALPDSDAARQGLPEFFYPDSCDPGTLNLKWRSPVK